jgi:hypothetical protein
MSTANPASIALPLGLEDLESGLSGQGVTGNHDWRSDMTSGRIART